MRLLEDETTRESLKAALKVAQYDPVFRKKFFQARREYLADLQARKQREAKIGSSPEARHANLGAVRRYQASEHGKAAVKRYQTSAKGKEALKLAGKRYRLRQKYGDVLADLV